VVSVLAALAAAGAGALAADLAQYVPGASHGTAAAAPRVPGDAAATAPSVPSTTAGAAAPAPRVRQMVVFRDGHALTKRVSTAATTVGVVGRHCAVGERTPLAALVRSRPGRLRLRDFGACSSSPRDAAGLLVTGIGPDRNRGQRGWVYKVGRRAATAGAADPSGPFGRGRLRAGQKITWFYCVRATDCQRTLELRATPVAGGVVATVRAYDDAGDGVPVEGATVTAGGVTGLTAADGGVQLSLAAGTHRVVARKDGLVRSFAEIVEVP
jgi:hypothetical protein